MRYRSKEEVKRLHKGASKIKRKRSLVIKVLKLHAPETSRVKIGRRSIMAWNSDGRAILVMARWKARELLEIFKVIK